MAMSWPATIFVGLILGLGATAWTGANETRSESSQTVETESDSSQTVETESGSSQTETRTSDTDESGSTTETTQTQTIEINSDGEKVVVLTFDDGPNPTFTPQILDILAEHDTHAVFCVIGEQVPEQPDLVRRADEDGHLLCNHTFTHDMQLADRTDAQITQELSSTLDAIEAAGVDADVPFVREPGGFVSPNVAAVAAELNMAPLNWTIDPRDWSRPGTDAIVTAVLDQLEPGGIILLNDGGGDRSQTVAALEPILEGIADAGYRVVLPDGTS
ncbi:MAG TPA: polysaccharide deacetylase family protein [Jiangellaceae bacterium]|nr:polysaccharide deacetylase family protein [Jiangellaceae bacterium]